MSGHLRGPSHIPGRGLSPGARTAHDGAVTSAAREGLSAHRDAMGVALPSVDLEWFWPSRRSHAYDEWCC
jgi:hypothetical protein